MVDRRQNSDFINCILTILWAHLSDFYLFDRIYLIVNDPLHFVDLAVRTITELFHHNEVINCR